MAHIEAGAQLAGDHVPGAGIGSQIADGSDQTRSVESQTLHRDHPLRRARHGIVAQSHRCRAGVPRATGKGHLRAGLSNDCVDYTEGSVFALEQDALLDVELQEAGYFVAELAIFYLERVESEGC